MRIRPLDIFALLFAVVVIVGFSLYAVERGGQENSVVVETDEGTFLYPLDQDRTVEFEGPLHGHTVVEIEDGKARFVSSPCRDKICIAAGWLEEDQEWAACLPNRVFVQLNRSEEEEEDEGVDAGTF
ncbi:MAG: NusG domain II-containing protein [Spirochaetaceae bacterium]